MMKRVAVLISLLCVSLSAKTHPLFETMKDVIAKQDVVCVFIDSKTGELITQDSVSINKRYTPCSTFKIWNTLIGAEYQIIRSAAESIYIWDSIPRFIPAWNKDLSLKEAFQVSCVPAYQILARNIGVVRMEKWIKILNYGDKDISSGIDDFWLPREGKKSIMISPIEQAQLIRKLFNGEMAFNQISQSILKEIMIVESTENGVYYGKTGSGTNLNENKEQKIGWFVGYVASKDQKYSFACLIKGENASGKDSKEIIETILKKAELI